MAQKLDHESFASLDPRHPLTQSDVNERELPKEIGKLWMEVARRLSFQQTEIDAIKMENPSDKERCIDLLVRWMNKEGREGATAGRLADALTKTGLKTLAEKLLGPSNGRRRIVIEITGTMKLHDNNEVMFGIDSFGKAMFFIWESERKEFKTSPEELTNYVEASQSEIVEQRISSQLENLEGKRKGMVTSLEIPELKADTFARSKKLDFIEKQSRTLQDLYSEVTRMTKEACLCNYILRRAFYDFTYHSLRSAHNDLSARLGDLESEEERMTDEEKRKLKTLLSYRKGRISQIKLLEKQWMRLFSPIDGLKKFPTAPSTSYSSSQTEASPQIPRAYSEGAQPKNKPSKIPKPRT